MKDGSLGRLGGPAAAAASQAGSDWVKSVQEAGRDRRQRRVERERFAAQRVGEHEVRGVQELAPKAGRTARPSP